MLLKPENEILEGVENQILHSTWCDPVVASVGKLNWSRKQKHLLMWLLGSVREQTPVRSEYFQNST